MSAIRLRRATPEDLPALVEIEFSAFPGDRISRRSWRDLMSSPSAIITAASRGAEIVGCYVVLINARTTVARLYSIAVVPELRRQGVAQRLIEDACDKSAQRGAASLRLETRADNHAAQNVFGRLGFRLIGNVAGYYEDGADAFRYERALNAEAVAATFSK